MSEAVEKKKRVPWTSGGWLRIAVTLALVGWLAYSIDWTRTGELVQRLEWRWAVLACGCYMLNRWLTTLKWWILLHAKGLRYPVRQLMRVVFVSNFLGHFLPSSVGGDNIRMIALAKKNARAPEAVSTVVMERITGAFTLALLAVGGALWSHSRWNESTVLAALVLPISGLLVVLALLLSKTGHRMVNQLLQRAAGRLPGGPFLMKLHAAIQSYRGHRAAVALALFISGLIQVSRVLAVWLLARALGITLFFGEALVLVPAALFVGALPISIAGWGVRESAFVVLLSLVGVPKHEAFGLSVLSRLTAMVSNLPGALFLITHGILGLGEEPDAKEPVAGRPIRVLRVIDKLGYADRLYGPGRQWLISLKAFDPNRCTVIPVVLRLNPGIAEHFAENGIDLIGLGLSRFDPRTIFELSRLMRENRVDVVHLSGYECTTLGRIAAAVMGVPAITHHHDTEDGLPWYIGWMDRFLAPLTARCIAVSEAVAEACIKRRHLRRSRIVVVPNAVEPSTEIPSAEDMQELRSQLGLSPGRPVVGSVTRFRVEKDVPTTLRALARLCTQGWVGMLLLLGDGPDRAELERKIHQMGLQNRVQLTGYVDNVRLYLELMDVVVFSSQTEGFCNALLEAMAAGRPVAVTAAGGIRELVVNGENGLMVPVGDDAALAQAVWKLLSDRHLAAELGQQAAQSVQRFQVPAMVEQLQAVYAAVLHLENRTEREVNRVAVG